MSCFKEDGSLKVEELALVWWVGVSDKLRDKVSMEEYIPLKWGYEILLFQGKWLP